MNRSMTNGSLAQARATRMIRAIPQWLKTFIETEGLGLQDWGCAGGESTALFRSAFPTSPITGYDPSPDAIGSARARWPDQKFTANPLDSDVVFVPATLTGDYLEALELRQKSSRQLLAVALPIGNLERFGDELMVQGVEHVPPSIGQGRLTLIYLDILKPAHADDTYAAMAIYGSAAVTKRILTASPAAIFERPPLLASPNAMVAEQRLAAAYIEIQRLTLREKAHLRAFADLADRRKRDKTPSFATDADEPALYEILARHPNAPIIATSGYEWDIPLFQRPHHLALNLGALGCLYFFCVARRNDAPIGFREIDKGCYLTDRYDLVTSLPIPKTVHVHAADFGLRQEAIEHMMRRGDTILYEYVDAIDEKISQAPIPKYLWDRHKWALANSDIRVVATASSLYEEVCEARQSDRNVALVPNGVDVAHFTVERKGLPPEEMRRAVASGKPIIGYFGAFATWFDYELIRLLASRRPDLEIVLVGWDYDKSLGAARLDEFENITVYGPIPYKKLPQHAVWFDVATIPFVINDVTLATSPIKAFEYMALGLPIVSTDMPECRKQETITISRSPKTFLTCIETALSLRLDSAFKKKTHAAAADNSWKSRAEHILTLLLAG